ncbi:MAG: hypothetical protein K8R99_08575 [Actinomycetia bacterium]|nr:hypothetical protein [Actinomycetes bacterium]
MNPVLTQRLVTFSSYFFGFLILDRMTFFGKPPSIIESFLMALVLGVAVTLLSPIVSTWLDRRASAGGRGPARVSRGRRPSGERDGMTGDPMDTDLGL